MARAPVANETTYIVYNSAAMMFGFEYLRESAAQKRVAALNKESGTDVWTYTDQAAFWQAVAAEKHLDCVEYHGDKFVAFVEDEEGEHIAGSFVKDANGGWSWQDSASV